MIRRKNFIGRLTLLVLVGIILFFNCLPAWAEKPHYRRNRQYPYHGRLVSLPETVIRSLFHAGREYYYYQGYFYRKHTRGYVVVAAPFGILVPNLPHGYKKVVVDGKRFYYYNGVFFIKEVGGYQVVPDPLYPSVPLPREVTVFKDAPVLDPAGETTLQTAGHYTVHIPNANGTFTAVTLSRLGEGFIGPQGEFYESFPEIELLQFMYGHGSD